MRLKQTSLLKIWSLTINLSGYLRPLPLSAGKQKTPTHPYKQTQAAEGTGRPLPTEYQTFFESKFDEDFDTVKIHDDENAAKQAEKLNAYAFTQGNHIVFGKNQVSPNTSKGKRLHDTFGRKSLDHRGNGGGSLVKPGDGGIEEHAMRCVALEYIRILQQVRGECRPDVPRQQIVHHQGHKLILPEVIAASKVLHETHA